MKIKTNCRDFGMKHGKITLWECPFLLHPAVHSGYTSKSGPITWVHCKLHKKAIRHISKCDLSGNYDLQKEKFIEWQRNRL